LGSAVSNEGRVEAVSEVVKKTSTSLGASPVMKKKNDVTLARKGESEKKIYIEKFQIKIFYFALSL